MHFLSNEQKLVMDHDPEKLLHILSNLLSNAIKFTPEGGDVYFQVDNVADCLQIRVKDTGIGIPASQLPFIFERFFSGSEDSPSPTYLEGETKPLFVPDTDPFATPPRARPLPERNLYGQDGHNTIPALDWHW
ncbi:MAG: ATP-binding protein [Lewinellaceae bacterium]|nr:ATP-binding protein [Lewinellaceae bacterium]